MHYFIINKILGCANEKEKRGIRIEKMFEEYNFKLVKTSAGYIHNPTYSAQLLIDSISDLAAGDSAISVDGIERP